MNSDELKKEMTSRLTKQKRGGLKGTTLKNGRWIAQINVKGKVMYIGSFDTEQEAHEAYSKELTYMKSLEGPVKQNDKEAKKLKTLQRQREY